MLKKIIIVFVLLTINPLSIKAENIEKSQKQNSLIKRENKFVRAIRILRENSYLWQEIEKEEQYYLSRRRHLPKGKSMGCVFKNPKNAYAGDLIERSGLKGLRIGGAKVSNEHANFIINEGNATSSDIKSLIALVKNAVRVQYGVCLEEEIRYLK